MSLPFQQSAQSTLGIEWELALVDAATGELRAEAPEVIAAAHEAAGLGPDDEHPHVTAEMLQNTVELVTGVHETVAISPFLDGVRDGSIEVDANTVLVIDEAAQLGPRQFLEVMRLWRDTGCTVRGMGDGEQCQSIEASSAVEIMVRNMPEEALPKLLYTVRQKTERAREIAGLFRGTELPGASP